MRYGVFITAFAALCPGIALAADVSYELALKTDYVYRGVSQTRSGPAVQASVAIDTESGWHGYLWGSNVDYVRTSDSASKIFDESLVRPRFVLSVSVAFE